MEGGHPVLYWSLRFENRAEGSDGKTMRHKDGETSDNGVSHFFFYLCKHVTANGKDSSTSLGMTIREYR